MNKLKYGTIAVGYEGSQARFVALCEDYRISNLDADYEQQIVKEYRGFSYEAIIEPTDSCPYYERMLVVSDGNSLLLGESAKQYLLNPVQKRI